MLVAGDTVDSNLSELTVFLEVYSKPISAAIASLRFIHEGDVEDIYQSFLLKVREKDLLRKYLEKKRAGKVKNFRGWLFRSLRNHTADYYRRSKQKPRDQQQVDLFDVADPHPGLDREATEDELLYAFSMLYVAVQHVRRHWQENAKPEVWSGFEEIYLRGLIPRLEANPDPGVAGHMGMQNAAGKPSQRTYNQAVSVLRVIRKVLPEIIPADLCDRPTPEERYQEWCSILVRSRVIRDLPLWLAFLQPPSLPPDSPAGNSENIAVNPVDEGVQPEWAHTEVESAIQAKVEAEAARERSEAESDELQVLLAFWLAMPFRDYVTIPPAITPGGAASALNLRSLIVDRADFTSTTELVETAEASKGLRQAGASARHGGV